MLTFVGIVTNSGLAFLTTWVVARQLGAAATGDFFLFTSIFTIAVGVIGLGADTGAVRMLSGAMATGRTDDVRPTLRVALVPVTVVAVGSAVLALVLAGPIASVLGGTDHGASTVRVLAVALAPGALLTVVLGASRGLGHVLTYTAVQNLSVPIMRLVAVASVVYASSRVELVVWAWALPVVLAAAVGGALLQHQLRQVSVSAAPSEEGTRELRARFWRFALPRGAAIVMERLLDWADVLVVVALEGPAAGGVYGVVTRIVVAGTMLEGALRIVMGPRLSAAAAVGDRAGVNRMFQRVTVALILVSWPYYIVVAVYAKDLLNLFGSQFTEGQAALVILAVAMALRNTMGALQTVLLMTGRSTWQLVNKIVQVSVLVVGAVVLVPAFGIAGAALAYALGVFVDTALATYQVTVGLRVRSDMRSMVRAAMYPTCGVLMTSLLLSWILSQSPTYTRLGAVGGVLVVYSGWIGVLLRRGATSFNAVPSP